LNKARAKMSRDHQAHPAVMELIEFLDHSERGIIR
jgi:hypothetical protein